MMVGRKIEKREYSMGVYLECAFKLSYLALAVSTFNSFLYTSPVQSLLVKVCLFFGACLAIDRLIFFQNYRNTPFAVLLLLFLISYAVSMLVNRQYEWIANGKWLIFTGMQFFLLYVCDRERDAESYRKEFRFLSFFLVLYSLLASVIGIVMMVGRYSDIFTVGDEEILTGFLWGRLWGIYTDPNYGAVFCVIACFLALYLFREGQKSWVRASCLAAAFLDTLYIAFSDSRTAKIAMAVAAAFYLFAILRDRLGEGWKGTVKRVLLAGIGAVFLIGYLEGAKNLYLYEVGPVVEEYVPAIQGGNAQDRASISAAALRAKDLESDISNRRFDLWISGLEVWKTTPVFGTGYVSFIPYAKENLPDTYAVNNDRGDFGNVHNEYLNILVFQGIFGVLIFLLFFVCVICYIWRRMWRLRGKDYFYILTLVTGIGSVAVSMLFVLDGIYTNSVSAVTLWMFLGYCIHDLSRTPMGTRE